MTKFKDQDVLIMQSETNETILLAFDYELNLTPILTSKNILKSFEIVQAYNQFVIARQSDDSLKLIELGGEPQLRILTEMDLADQKTKNIVYDASSHFENFFMRYNTSGFNF